tara:strand:- start:348 stop:1466 length:1119 start_codon:yes stop_codon:yes gene_type:complete
MRDNILNSDDISGVQTIFGANSISKLKEFVEPDAKILLITSKSIVKHGFLDRVIDALPTKKYDLINNVTPNPELDLLEHLITHYRDNDYDLILALGGGSVIDTGKTLSVGLLVNQQQPLIKIFNKEEEVYWKDAIKIIAIPTSAGTGSEATHFATIWDQKKGRKFSLTTPLILPKIAILDPMFTTTLSYKETRNTALDAISHSLESLWNKNRTLQSEAYAYEALELSYKNLPLALAEPDNIQARSNMQISSHLAGKAIAKTKTAIAHSISYPITAHLGIPHGLACSFTLVSFIRRYKKIVKLNNIEEQLFQRIEDLLVSLNLPQLIQEYSTDKDIMSLTDKMFTPGRSDNYSLDFTMHDLEDVIFSSVYKSN